MNILNVNRLQEIENKIRKFITTFTSKLSYKTLKSLNVLLSVIVIFLIKLLLNSHYQCVVRA
jgi:hypothetical protein